MADSIIMMRIGNQDLLLAWLSSPEYKRPVYLVD